MILSTIIENTIAAFKNTSWTEWFIFVTALVYVILAAANSIWCWLFGILSSAFSIYLCYSGHLYLESGLQIFYVAIGIYGWYSWKYGSEKKEELPIRRIPNKLLLYVFLTGIMVWIPLGMFSAHYSTQVLPYLDAFITSFSLVATWMTAKRYLENWWYWVVIDGLAIYLYASREFYLIALIYILYTFLAAAGYFAWRKKLSE